MVSAPDVRTSGTRLELELSITRKKVSILSPYQVSDTICIVIPDGFSVYEFCVYAYRAG